MFRRDSHHSSRISSRSESEHSSKRSRRDVKPTAERASSSHNFKSEDPGSDQRLQKPLQDNLPHEAPLALDSNTQRDVVLKGLDKKYDGQLNGINCSSDPTEVPRLRSFFQHDERGSAGQGGRSFSRRATGERGRYDIKDQSGDRKVDKVKVDATQKRDEKFQPRLDENSMWRHDRFYELQADAPPPKRKRPAFREKKLSPELGNVAGTTAATTAVAAETEPLKPSHLDQPAVVSAKREERGGYNLQGSMKAERQFMDANDRRRKVEDRMLHRGEMWRSGYSSRDRFGNGNGYRGRESFTGRYSERKQDRPVGFHVEKWKHDLFDEANRSPTPKNEEDQIAKVEALLAL